MMMKTSYKPVRSWDLISVHRKGWTRAFTSLGLFSSLREDAVRDQVLGHAFET